MYVIAFEDGSVQSANPPNRTQSGSTPTTIPCPASPSSVLDFPTTTVPGATPTMLVETGPTPQCVASEGGSLTLSTLGLHYSISPSGGTLVTANPGAPTDTK